MLSSMRTTVSFIQMMRKNWLFASYALTESLDLLLISSERIILSHLCNRCNTVQQPLGCSCPSWQLQHSNSLIINRV